MTPDSNPGADRVAVCAGTWRPVEMSDGDILKLFQSGKQGEKNYRQFDGEWYVLDESPEAIAEARQEARINRLTHENEQLNSVLASYVTSAGADSERDGHRNAEIDGLTAENERLRRERDRLLDSLELMIKRFEIEAPKSDDELFFEAWSAINSIS